MEKLRIKGSFGGKLRIFAACDPASACIMVNQEDIALTERQVIETIQYLAKINGIEIDIKIPISYSSLVYKVSPETALHYSLKAGQEIKSGNLFTAIIKHEKDLQDGKGKNKSR